MIQQRYVERAGEVVGLRQGPNGEIRGKYFPRSGLASDTVFATTVFDDGELVIFTDLNEIRRGNGTTPGGVTVSPGSIIGIEEGIAAYPYTRVVVPGANDQSNGDAIRTAAYSAIEEYKTAGKPAGKTPTVILIHGNYKILGTPANKIKFTSAGFTQLMIDTIGPVVIYGDNATPKGANHLLYVETGTTLSTTFFVNLQGDLTIIGNVVIYNSEINGSRDVTLNYDKTHFLSNAGGSPFLIGGNLTHQLSNNLSVYMIRSYGFTNYAVGLDNGGAANTNAGNDSSIKLEHCGTDNESLEFGSESEQSNTQAEITTFRAYYSRFACGPRIDTAQVYGGVCGALTFRNAGNATFVQTQIQGIQCDLGVATVRVTDCVFSTIPAFLFGITVLGTWESAIGYLPDMVGNPPVDIIGTATLDFPSTPANSSASLTMNVPGAHPGQHVEIVPPVALESRLFKGTVTTDETVTVRHINFTASAVDPASGVFTAIVKGRPV